MKKKWGKGSDIILKYYNNSNTGVLTSKLLLFLFALCIKWFYNFTICTTMTMILVITFLFFSYKNILLFFLILVHALFLSFMAQYLHFKRYILCLRNKLYLKIYIFYVLIYNFYVVISYKFIVMDLFMLNYIYKNVGTTRAI